MINEPRLIIRLIALWIIFVGSLGFFAWALPKLSMAVAKTINHGYDTYYGYYPSSYNNYCLQSPVYPQSPLDSTDLKVSEKYNQELQKYNEEYTAACKKDLVKSQEAEEKQEQSQKDQNKAAAAGDLATYGALSLLSLAAAYISFKMIKKSEQA